jgi:hypothetical protein
MEPGAEAPPCAGPVQPVRIRRVTRSGALAHTLLCRPGRGAPQQGNIMQKKIVPAVWFQNKLGPAQPRARKPAVLELFERDLARAAGGIITDPIITYDAPGVPGDSSGG